ncbi:MAG: hypothetical protein HQL35_10595 [Alphaproteobacteria bacterium]|nr:hypothetical protein [Alphaproteobacteria bacterium]
MSISIIISVLAFGVAMVTLWLASDISKKIEQQNERFLRTHIKTLREDVAAIQNAVRDTVRVVKERSENHAGVERLAKDNAAQMESVRAKLAELDTRLSELDASIPKRYRAARPQGSQPNPGAPSIQ